MDSRGEILIENILTDTINAIYELSDRKKSHEYAKEFFDRFCAENGVDRIEAYEVLTRVLGAKIEMKLIRDKNKFKGMKSALLSKSENNKFNARAKQKKRDECEER